MWMGKKESAVDEGGGPDIFDKIKSKIDEAGGGQSKVPGLSNKAFGFVKFLLGVSLAPFVYAMTRSFLDELALVDPTLQQYFWRGVTSFLVVFFFFFEPAKVYQKGQRILEIIFHFFAPLVKVAPYLLPVYTIIIFVAGLIATMIWKAPEVFNYFVLALSFSFTLHLVYSAKTMRTKQDFLKANYLFGFSLIFMLNVVLMAFFLNILSERFSFVHFFNMTCSTGGGIFKMIFDQLFVPKV